MPAPRVFLTGATGFIGQRLVQALRQRGCPVIGLVRRPETAEARALAAGGMTLASGDVTDRESLRLPMQAADVVVHAAGVYELGVVGIERERMTAVNVRGTEHVLSMAHELGCSRVLQVSSVLALGDTGASTRDEAYARQAPPGSHYEWTQAEAYRIALDWRRRGLPVMLACPNAVVGANDHSVFGYLFRLYLNGLMPPLLSGLNHVISPVWVDDLAHGLAAAALDGQPADTWLFCGERQRYREMFALWARHAGGAQPVRDLPPPLAKLLFGVTAPLLRALGLPAFVSLDTLRASTINLDYISVHAQRALGWRVTPAARVWEAIGAEESGLLSARGGQGLAQRLRPMSA
jgi:nucleoside-diphosphate-sugar epimerase